MRVARQLSTLPTPGVNMRSGGRLDVDHSCCFKVVSPPLYNSGHDRRSGQIKAFYVCFGATVDPKPSEKGSARHSFWAVAGTALDFALDGVIAAIPLLASSFTPSAKPGTIFIACRTISDDASSCHGLPWLSASTNRRGISSRRVKAEVSSLASMSLSYLAASRRNPSYAREIDALNA